MYAVVGIAIGASAACAAILAWLLKTGLAWRMATDVPNDRSLHERPTPRVGGWGIVPVALAAVALLAPRLWLVALCVFVLAVVSQVDDRRSLPAHLRFIVHCATVALFVMQDAGSLPFLGLGAAFFLLVWLTNLYNFMDGSDGLAGGMAVFGFGAYAVAAATGQHVAPELAWLSAAIAGAAAGFLIYNFHPARMFLGDAGSIPLGFLAGALGYYGWRSGVWPVWFPAMAFSPFVADASVTLVRRLFRGEKVWQAHRDHYYQRMVRSGLGHARTARYWYVLMGAGAALAIWARTRSVSLQWSVVAVWCFGLTTMGAVVDFRWRQFARFASTKGNAHVGTK
jgi:UDP-N-acetylmuramyl pentapeptide phosphotransferase/UDP-N-acetylglucosamine-1-phosphate transferase